MCPVKSKKMMIEIFKTDITCADKAKWLIEQIHQTFSSYKANFDLEDCDKILRVVNSKGYINNNFIDWLKNAGCNAEILADS